MKGQAAIKYVIDINFAVSDNKAPALFERALPTEDDWSRIVTHARIFGWLDGAIVVNTTPGGKIDPIVQGKAWKHTQPARMLVHVNTGSITLALQFLTDTDLSRVSFEVPKSEKEIRYLSAYFDAPVRLPAGQTVRMLFRSPAETERTADALGGYAEENYRTGTTDSGLEFTITAFHR